MDRAKLFRLALFQADMTLVEWARVQNPPVTTTTVYRLLEGDLVSARLEEAMDNFIGQHIPALKAAIAE